MERSIGGPNRGLRLGLLEILGGPGSCPPLERDTARAMSQENVQIIIDTAAAFNRGDDAWLEYWADDIDYRAVEGAPDDPGPIHGRPGCALTCRTGSTPSISSRSSRWK
jgi:hypothetical protein